MKRRVMLPAAVVLCVGAVVGAVQPALAEVDLLFDPAMQSISVDETDIVEIDLIAHSADGTAQAVVALDAVLSWDPDFLELLGVDDGNAGVAWFVDGFLNDPDDINSGTSIPPIGVPSNDGDAIYSALSQPDTPVAVGPDDLIVTTIRFRALQLTSGTIVSFLPSLGQFGETRVFGEGIQNNITGDISATALVAIVQLCSEDCPTDIDGNFETGAFDLAVLLACWGPVVPGVCECLDADDDGDIGPFDLAVLLAAWGSCIPTAGACCNADGVGGCELLLGDDCDAAGGDFLGANSVCDDCPHQGCAPDAGDCCVANGTPGCDNPNCCNDVCDIDPSCCEVEWTGACVVLAESTCLACFPPPANDDCADAVGILDGLTGFDTVGATTDGPAHAACQFDGQTYNDIWYDYVATCSGTLTVTTCEDLGGSADYDTDLVVYDECDCPIGDGDLIGCNDDDTANSCGGSPDFHSTVLVPVNVDQCYKIRIGGFAPPNSGSGTLLVSCDP